MLQDSENCLLHIVHDDVQVDLILLIPLCVECMLKLNNIWMKELFHNLKLSILVPLVLVNFFYRNFLVGFINDCLEHHTEGAIADDTLRIVGIACGLLVSLHLLLATGLSILQTFFFKYGFKI